MRWKKWLAGYLYYSRSERNSLLFLGILLVSLVAVPRTIDFFQPRPVSRPRVLVVPVKATINRDTLKEGIAAPVEYQAPQPFDPNLVAAATLQGWGVPERAVNNLIRYREKGGKFFRQEDLQKIYGFEEVWYDSLRDYIRLPADKKTTYRPKARSPVSIIDINEADQEAWQALRGIGPVLSGRIIAFRDKLGGFYSVDQLAETWGLPDSTFQSIRSSLKVSPPYRPLMINELPLDSLAGHPYLSWKQARTLVRYRDNHGPFGAVSDLLQTEVIDSSDLVRLDPYLNFGADGN